MNVAATLSAAERERACTATLALMAMIGGPISAGRLHRAAERGAQLHIPADDFALLLAAAAIDGRLDVGRYERCEFHSSTPGAYYYVGAARNTDWAQVPELHERLGHSYDPSDEWAIAERLDILSGSAMAGGDTSAAPVIH